jgi:hypothetical protein
VYLSKSHGGCSGITKRIFSPEYYTTMDNICKTKTKNECKVSDSCVFLNDVSCVVGDDAGPSLDSAEYKRTWTSFTRIDAMVRVKCRR